ncbi:hypothetical protein [Janthinobacterium sp. HH01]|uniref:hypothetical protein n=1 Tax=Janthinobacterium sp. HH01 TaxID=1198452 RepID=UPI001268565C|nr:hypothetical protein [Janthinobacterium sp. HH01]
MTTSPEGLFLAELSQLRQKCTLYRRCVLTLHGSITMLEIENCFLSNHLDSNWMATYKMPMANVSLCKAYHFAKQINAQISTRNLNDRTSARKGDLGEAINIQDESAIYRRGSSVAPQGRFPLPQVRIREVELANRQVS